MADIPTFVTAYRGKVTRIANADGVTPQLVYQAGVVGSRVHAVALGSTDPTSREVSLLFAETVGAAESAMGLLGVRTVPGGAGESEAVAIVSWLDKTQHPWLDDSPGRFITLGPGEALYAKTTAAVASGETVSVTVFAGDY